MGTGGRTIAAFGLLLVSACAAPTQISSNKAQDYTAQPTRLFVVTMLAVISVTTLPIPFRQS